MCDIKKNVTKYKEGGSKEPSQPIERGLWLRGDGVAAAVYGSIYLNIFFLAEFSFSKQPGKT